MIRPCTHSDFEQIFTIINDGARAYQGIIPREQLQHEIDEGVMFWGDDEKGTLTGVMGIQPVQDVTLIRHAYVRTTNQKQGIGSRLLSHLQQFADGPVLIGAWADASWAIRFYERISRGPFPGKRAPPQKVLDDPRTPDRNLGSPRGPELGRPQSQARVINLGARSFSSYCRV
jgi:GNAT superfamily N-acetyltransferase